MRLLSFHSSETLVCDRSRPTYHQYNPETVVAIVRSAEAKRSSTQILLFPWAITYANCLLVSLVADAFHSAKVRIILYPNHAQSENTIKTAADVPGCPFGNILVDMSHYEEEENLVKAKTLTEYRHARGIATEPILATWRIARTVSRI